MYFSEKKLLSEFNSFFYDTVNDNIKLPMMITSSRYGKSRWLIMEKEKVGEVPYLIRRIGSRYIINGSRGILRPGSISYIKASQRNLL